VKSKNLKMKKSEQTPKIDWNLVNKSPKVDTPDEDSPELFLGKMSKKMTLHEALNTGKTRITIMLDDSIIQSNRLMAGGRGYQTLINETLRRGLEIENVKNALREVLREEKNYWVG
jgi:uncharacterized protein (DUF4415 family)